jgi:hypothetical protein
MSLRDVEDPSFSKQSVRLSALRAGLMLRRYPSMICEAATNLGLLSGKGRQRDD